MAEEEKWRELEERGRGWARGGAGKLSRKPKSILNEGNQIEMKERRK